MRIRIIDVDYADLRDGVDLPLSCWGVAAGDEFEVILAGPDMFIIECGAGYVFVYSRECEVLED